MVGEDADNPMEELARVEEDALAVAAGRPDLAPVIAEGDESSAEEVARQVRS